jgi:hypothetical protein
MIRIPLTRGYCAIVDDDVRGEVEKHHWHATNTKKNPTWYARTTIHAGKEQTHLRMHRFIMAIYLGRPIEKNEQVDHKNRNGLDNRRENLRLATPSQNHANQRRICPKTSIYKGVYWNKSRCKWGAHIKVNQVGKGLGFFECEKDAAMVYNSAAIHFFGEFAYVNNVPGGVVPYRGPQKKRNKSSRFKGVYWNKNEKLWYARITIDKKRIWLGQFHSETEAARMYFQTKRRQENK